MADNVGRGQGAARVTRFACDRGVIALVGIHMHRRSYLCGNGQPRDGSIKPPPLSGTCVYLAFFSSW